jgi:hypothetical protein
MPDSKQVIQEMLYDLTRDELRQIIWEALLISDGPGKIEGEVWSTIGVEFKEKTVSTEATFTVTSEAY